MYIQAIAKYNDGIHNTNTQFAHDRTAHTGTGRVVRISTDGLVLH